MDNFYGYEEKRIEKIKPIVETPLELKRKLNKQKSRRKGSEEDGIVSRNLTKG